MATDTNRASGMQNERQERASGTPRSRLALTASKAKKGASSKVAGRQRDAKPKASPATAGRRMPKELSK